MHFATAPDGCVVVDVHLVVRNFSGDVLMDQMVQHAYIIENGRIKAMDIQKV